MIKAAQVGRTVSLTVGAIGLAGVGAVAALRRPLPRTSGTLRLPGLRGRVQVLRDRWGVPHIYADTHEDLFASLGYVHAQDRLWQMELNRRTAHGQLAELFGKIALSSDRFVRTLGLSRVARREVELLDEHSRSVIEAYVRGVNAFMAAHTARLPLEFTILRHQPRPWEPVDSLVWGKMLALSLSANWTIELLNARLVAAVGEERARELLPSYPDGHPVTVPAGIRYSPTIGEGALRAAAAAAPFLQPPDLAQGSNAWSVGGERSASGRPLLASDPHLALALPSIWYEAHLEGGDYAVTGVTFPGVPGVVIGHNAHIAWGITNALNDVQDLYIERFHPDDPLRYEWRGEWIQAETVREEIKVKGQPRPFVEDVRITRHGPIITSVATPDDAFRPEEDLALRWTALEPSYVFQSILELNRARNWDEFRTALAHWDTPPQNFVYADVNGHFGYALGGRIPIRAQGDGCLPVPGWSGDYEWTGYIPNAALPAAYDPPEGLVVNANNRIAGDTYVYHTHLQGEWLNGYRAARIQALLESTPKHDAHSFARIQNDLFSLPGVELARLVADLPLQDPLERRARDLLVQWDGNLHAESVGGTIYATLLYHLERQAYAGLDDLHKLQAGLGIFGVLPKNIFLIRAFPNILARIAAAEGPQRHDPWLGDGRTWVRVLQECMRLTVAELRRQLGKSPTSWRYGRTHSLTLRHPLGNIAVFAPIFNRGPWPTGGDIDTVCMGYAPRDTVAGPLYTAPSCRQICDPSNWDASRTILASGQSGHPGSRHYNDMAPAWRAGAYHPMLWSRARVEQHTVARLVLEPAPERRNTAEAVARE